MHMYSYTLSQRPDLTLNISNQLIQKRDVVGDIRLLRRFSAV